MPRAELRFYAELNDFLPPARRGRAIAYVFDVSGAVKDVIESLGVPHTEVDLIVVNGESVGFDYLVRDGDQISVYPVFESLDITPLVRVRPKPLREVKFVLDAHLGKLAMFLRMCGFDSLYRNDYRDDELARISHGEGRILLTRDRGLLKRSLVTHGYLVRSDDPREQLGEVIRRFDLRDALKPLQRCLRCNGELEPVPKEAVADRLPPRTREHYNTFVRCHSCGQVYWPGSHYDRMREFIERVTKEASEVTGDR